MNLNSQFDANKLEASDKINKNSFHIQHSSGGLAHQRIQWINLQKEIVSKQRHKGATTYRKRRRQHCNCKKRCTGASVLKKCERGCITWRALWVWVRVRWRASASRLVGPYAAAGRGGAGVAGAALCSIPRAPCCQPPARHLPPSLSRTYNYYLPALHSTDVANRYSLLPTTYSIFPLAKFASLLYRRLTEAV